MLKALRKEDTEILPTAVMVRQPIYDENLKVVAYKLLYKDEAGEGSSLFSDSEFAIHVMLEEYTSVYEAGEVKCLPAFIQLSPGTAMQLQGSSEGTEIYVELDAGVCSESELETCIGHLVEQGFKIVLSGCDGKEDVSSLVNRIDVVRMNVAEMDMDRVTVELERYRERSELLVLAENIDSVEILEQCVELGFDLFQGQFLSKPRAMSEGKLNVNQTSIVQLIAELQKPDASPESIEQIVQMDPALTYKLLRIVNSAAYSLVREVTSIADTIVLLGLEQVRQLAIVISTSSQSDKPSEMFRSMLMRGHMCEVIAKKTNPGNKSACFLAGIMSGLHLMLDTTPANLLRQLPVADDIRAAILEHTGPVGELLENTINYEEGNWDKLPEDIDIELYESAYKDAIRWVNEIMGSAS